MPALPAFRVVQPDDDGDPDMMVRVLRALVQSCADSLRPLLLSSRSSSVVQSVSIGTGATVINHKVSLGAAKNPNGWAITDIDTNATVKRTAWDATTITLIASAACVAQLEVW
jgi:hypothetical protein